MERAAQQRDAPVEALELKLLNDDLHFINVRLAGDPGCYADLEAQGESFEGGRCNGYWRS
jgi:hypothetical protein